MVGWLRHRLLLGFLLVLLFIFQTLCYFSGSLARVRFGLGFNAVYLNINSCCINRLWWINKSEKLFVISLSSLFSSLWSFFFLLSNFSYKLILLSFSIPSWDFSLLSFLLPSSSKLSDYCLSYITWVPIFLSSLEGGLNGNKDDSEFHHNRSRGVTSHFTKDIKRKQITLILKKEKKKSFGS